MSKSQQFDDEKSLRLDARRNLDKLRDAATTAFQEVGLGVSLKEIARRAGVSPGTLYNRFGSREALIDDVVFEIAIERLELAVNLANSEDRPWLRFTCFLWEMGKLQAENPMFSDIFSGRFPLAKKLEHFCQQSMSHAQHFIEEAQVEGSLRADFIQEDFFLILLANGCLLQSAEAEKLGGWRRKMALTIDGLQACASSPLPNDGSFRRESDLQ